MWYYRNKGELKSEQGAVIEPQSLWQSEDKAIEGKTALVLVDEDEYITHKYSKKVFDVEKSL